MTLPPRSADRERHASTDPATPEYWFLRVRFCSFDDSDFPVEASLCRLAPARPPSRSCPKCDGCPARLLAIVRTPARQITPRHFRWPCKTPALLLQGSRLPFQVALAATRDCVLEARPLFLQRIYSEISIIG